MSIHALQRTAASRYCCNRRVAWPPSLSLGRSAVRVGGIVIETARLKLMPATVALARAEIGDRGEFARLLGASVPDNWPPETLADALPLFLGWLEAAPDRVGWFGWYAFYPTTQVYEK